MISRSDRLRGVEREVRNVRAVKDTPCGTCGRTIRKGDRATSFGDGLRHAFACPAPEPKP